MSNSAVVLQRGFFKVPPAQVELAKKWDSFKLHPGTGSDADSSGVHAMILSFVISIYNSVLPQLMVSQKRRLFEMMMKWEVLRCLLDMFRFLVTRQ